MLIRFSCDLGEAIGIWVYGYPKIGKEYYIEIDITQEIVNWTFSSREKIGILVNNNFINMICSVDVIDDSSNLVMVRVNHDTFHIAFQDKCGMKIGDCIEISLEGTQVLLYDYDFENGQAYDGIYD
ncbi:MAG: hypothetical protein LBT59_10760 [Clostridiales bacterium]|nr:hypothetical protein [Clostridiales bacterium]